MRLEDRSMNKESVDSSRGIEYRREERLGERGRRIQGGGGSSAEAEGEERWAEDMSMMYDLYSVK